MTAPQDLNNVVRFLAHLAKATPEERDYWDLQMGYMAERLEMQQANRENPAKESDRDG